MCLHGASASLSCQSWAASAKIAWRLGESTIFDAHRGHVETLYGPRWCQNGPKMAPRWPKMSRRCPKMAPGWRQEGQIVLSCSFVCQYFGNFGKIARRLGESTSLCIYYDFSWFVFYTIIENCTDRARGRRRISTSTVRAKKETTRDHVVVDALVLVFYFSVVLCQLRCNVGVCVCKYVCVHISIGAL